MTENDCTDPLCPVKLDDSPVLERGMVYTRRALLARCGATDRTFAAWREAGLEPLASHTKEDLFLSDEVIAIWLKRPKPKKGEKA